MMNTVDVVTVWYSDYGTIYLKRVDDRLMLKRFTPVDYDYMQEYIDNNCDLFSEWQEAVANWETESGYDSWREDYSYDYGNRFTQDNGTDEYYDDNDSDMTWDWFYTNEYDKETTIERVMQIWNSDYFCWSFEWADRFDEHRFEQIIWELYDDCVEYRRQLEESRKPHWNVFKYYKE